MEGTIIIGEDDPSMADFITYLLEKNFPEYEYELYESGKDVEERFKKGFEGAKLAILDEVMDPGLRGTELIKKYSSDALEKGCKMVLYSTEDYKAQEALSAGAVAYFNKFATHTFKEGLESILNGPIRL